MTAFATAQILFNTNNTVAAGWEIVAASSYWEAVYAGVKNLMEGVEVPRSRYLLWCATGHWPSSRRETLDRPGPTPIRNP